MAEVLITLGTRDTRSLLARQFSGMRPLRQESLATTEMNARTAKAYLSAVFRAATYVKSLTPGAMEIEKRKMIDALIGTIATSYDVEPSLHRYDCRQDAWWCAEPQWEKFVLSLRKLAAFYLRGSLSSPEDAFHMLQVLKYLHESGEERKSPAFLLPAYGGLWLDDKYVGPNLLNLTGNKSLVPLKHEDNLLLRLDWWPDDTKAGTEEVESLVKAARLLGYVRVEFWLPGSFKYDDLRSNYGPRLQCRMDGERCWASISLLEANGHAKNLLQELELDDRQLADVPADGFVSQSILRVSSSGYGLALHAEECVGFGRMLFAIDEGQLSARGGLYVPDKAATADALKEAFEKIKGALSGESLNSMLMQVGDKLNAMLAYATVRKGEQDLHDIELVGGSFNA